MPLIHTVHPDQAEGQVKEIYDQVAAAFGSVPTAMQIYSASPIHLEEHWRGIGYYMQHPTLNFALLAMIRMLVSMNTNCEYCVGFNEGLLINRAGFSVEQIAATKADPTQAPLPVKDVAMLSFVLKATHDSTSTTAADIENLRHHGWTDSDILDALSHGAQMLAGDTILNAFKVERDF